MPVPPVIQMYRYVMGSGGGLGNLLKASEEFQQTVDWVRYPTNSETPTVNADSRPDPNGGTTADQVDYTANTGARLMQTVTLKASTEYTFSVHARAVSGTVDFRMRNITLKAAVQKTATTTGPDGGGFTRFDYTFTTGAAGSYELALQNASGTPTARSVIFWGAMLNEGGTALDYDYAAPTTGGSAPAPAYAGFGDAFGGVTAYYSLRQFTEAETLNAIRVRRSSDDTEQDIGFDANGDLDTTALTTFVNEDVEKIVNGDFATDTDWTKGTGWSIADGKASSDGSQTTSSSLFQACLAIGETHNFTMTITDYVSGSVLLRNGVGASEIYISAQSANGTYTATAVVDGGGTNTTLVISASADFVGAISFVSAIQTTADGAVTTFYDQSGNGNNATNSTASEQPLVVSGGGVLVDGNGKAKIQATAATQYLTATRIDPNPLYSFYALEKGTSTGAFSGFTGQWTDSYAIFFGSTRASVFDTSGTRHNVSRGTTMTSGNRYLISAVFDNDIEIYQDGTLEGSVSGVGDLRFSNTAQKLRFFSYSANNSDPDSCLQEVIIFNSDQSTNRTGIETNINDHFDIYP